MFYHCRMRFGCVSDRAYEPTNNLASKLQDGDIIFQTSKSGQSSAIQLATHSAYSHMGIIFREGGRWCVYEAVGPVRFTPLQDWISRGGDAQAVVKRLKDKLSIDAVAKLKDAGQAFLGKPYDPYFGWSDDRIYCSELVWKMYKYALGIEIGHPRALRSFDLSSPLVQKKLRERFGDHVPLDEKAVTPSIMFESPLLQTIR